MIQIPTKLFATVIPRKLRFHELHAMDGGRIHYKRVCETDGKEVPASQVAKGYALGDKKIVLLDPKELRSQESERDPEIRILHFVERKQVDPIYFEASYYLVPEKGGAAPYALLIAALQRTGKAAVASFTMRGREHIALLRPGASSLVLSALRSHEEVVQEPRAVLRDASKSQARNLEIATALIQSMSGEFRPERFPDPYRERILALVERKARIRRELPAPSEIPATGQVIDLMKALKRSVGSSQGRKTRSKKKVA